MYNYKDAVETLKAGLKVDSNNNDIKNRLKEVEKLYKEEEVKRKKHGNKTPAIIAKDEGNDFYSKGRFPEAIECYTKGLNLATLDSERITLYNNRATCKFQERSFRQAIADCTQVLELDPVNIKALLRRGLAYENVSKVEPAIADMKALQQLSPGMDKVSQALHRLNRMKRQKEGHSW